MRVSVKSLILQKGKILLLKPRYLKNSVGGWDGPGGTIKKGESISETLAREVFEETGLRLKMTIPVRALLSGDGSTLYLIFLCSVDKGKISLSQEHTRYKWASPKELEKLTGYDLLRELKEFKKSFDGFLFSLSPRKTR